MTGIFNLLGNEAETLLSYRCSGISKKISVRPDRILWIGWWRTVIVHTVMRALQTLFNQSRLAGTGCLPILPVARRR